MGEGRERERETKKDRKRRSRAVILCMRNVHYFLLATASSSESQHPRFASHVRFLLNKTDYEKDFHR